MDLRSHTDVQRILDASDAVTAAFERFGITDWTDQDNVLRVGRSLRSMAGLRPLPRRPVTVEPHVPDSPAPAAALAADAPAAP